MDNLENLTVEALDGDDYDKKFSDMFSLLGFIGKGAFGSVVRATRLGEKNVNAVKVIEKRNVSENEIEKLKEEAYILAEMNHPNIVKFRDIQETESKLFIVMEYVKGGTLKELIVNRRSRKERFNDLEASILMKSILSALSYMHTHNIIHRDIKPENILVGDVNDFSSIKIADFGLSANFFKDGFMQSTLHQRAGTLIYMAPELLLSKMYSKPVDIWSCAFIMYILLSGGMHPLFSVRDNADSYKEKLKNPKWDYKDYFTPLAKDLFMKMTKLNPLERITADECLKHPWITRKTDEEIPLISSEFFKTFSITTVLTRLIKALYMINIPLNNPNVTEDYFEKALVFSKQHSKEFREIRAKRKPKLTYKEDNLLSNLVGAIKSRNDESRENYSMEDHCAKDTPPPEIQHYSSHFIRKRADSEAIDPNVLEKVIEPKVVKPSMKKSLRKTVLIQNAENTKVMDKLPVPEESKTARLPTENDIPGSQLLSLGKLPKTIDSLDQINPDTPTRTGNIFKSRDSIDKIEPISNQKEVHIHRGDKDPAKNDRASSKGSAEKRPDSISEKPPSRSYFTKPYTTLKPATTVKEKQETNFMYTKVQSSKSPEPKSSMYEPNDPKIVFSMKKVPTDPVHSPKTNMNQTKFKIATNGKSTTIIKTEPYDPTKRRTAQGTRPYSFASPQNKPMREVTKKGDFFVYESQDDFADLLNVNRNTMINPPLLQAGNFSPPDLVKLSKAMIIKTNAEMDMGKSRMTLPKIGMSKSPNSKSTQVFKPTFGGVKPLGSPKAEPPTLTLTRKISQNKPDPLDILLRGQSINLSEKEPQFERKQSRLMSITGNAKKK